MLLLFALGPLLLHALVVACLAQPVCSHVMHAFVLREMKNIRGYRNNHTARHTGGRRRLHKARGQVQVGLCSDMHTSGFDRDAFAQRAPAPTHTRDAKFSYMQSTYAPTEMQTPTNAPRHAQTHPTYTVPHPQPSEAEGTLTCLGIGMPGRIGPHRHACPRHTAVKNVIPILDQLVP